MTSNQNQGQNPGQKSETPASAPAKQDDRNKTNPTGDNAPRSDKTSSS